MKLVISLFLLFLFQFSNTLGQFDSTGRQFPEYYSYFKIDTLEFHSKKIKIVHTLERTKDLKSNIFRKNELIFNDSANKISRLHITNNHLQTISISTIPINNIIIDDSNELIIGLSRAIVSPYHLVIYNFEGELLFRKNISQFELVLDSINYILFRDSFPAYYEYAKLNKQLIQDTNNLYYIDINFWHLLTEKQQLKIHKLGWLHTSHYFPLFLKCFDCTLPYELSEYTNFYSQTDPFYDYEYYNGNIKGIILNDEYGGKVKIPIFIE